MNKAAMAAFRAFLAAVREEAEDVIITSPVLNMKGHFDGLLPGLGYAEDWFEMMEPVLYEYLLKVPTSLLRGKALVIAEGIIESSYSHYEDAWKAYNNYRKTGKVGSGVYKPLSSKLIVVAQNDPSWVTIEGEKYDDWLGCKDADNGWGIPVILKPYDPALWIVPEDPLEEDSPMGPAFSYERLEELANQWREHCRAAKPRTTPRKERSLQRVEQVLQGAEREMQRFEKRIGVLSGYGFDERDPYLVPAVRTRRKLKDTYPWPNKLPVRVNIPKMGERWRMEGATGRKAVTRMRMAEVKERWREAGHRWGVLLEKAGDGRNDEAPSEDFLLAEDVFDRATLARPAPGIMGYQRNTLSRWGYGKKQKPPEMAIARSLERWRKEKHGVDRFFKTDNLKERDRILKRLMKDTGEKYLPGSEPKTYYLGPRTGNLYPVKFLHYVGYLSKELPEGSKYQPLVTNETVLAELLHEDPYVPEAHRAEELKYRPPDNKLILCFEDELVNIVPGLERMRRADLHRYLESWK